MTDIGAFSQRQDKIFQPLNTPKDAKIFLFLQAAFRVFGG